MKRSICVLWLSTAFALLASAQAPTFDGCPVFPANNVWNTRIDTLPLDPNSSTYIYNVGASDAMHAAFSASYGYPLNTVTGSQPKVQVTFRYLSDPGPYPIPSNVGIEKGSDGHAFIVDTTNCILYELFALYESNGAWYAGSGAIFSLNSNALRTNGWTSADAAGLPMFPGTLRYDEVISGHVDHALRFTAPHTRNQYVWPARHWATLHSSSQYPEFGMRFRLKASFDISSFSPHVQTILQAMKTYGMFLADNGSPWDFCGFEDPRWDSTELHEFTKLVGADFEVVDESSLMVNINSGQAVQQSSATTPSGNWVQIVSKGSGECLSIGGGPGATGAGDLADQSACAGGTNQQFLLTALNAGGYRIMARNSLYSLVLKGEKKGTANGVPVMQAYFNDQPPEIWAVIRNSNGTYSFKVQSTGKCMTVSGNGSEDGAQVVQSTCSGVDTQQWTIEPAS